MPDAPAPIHRSPRRTRRRVYVIDRIADVVISGGGLVVVAAVMGILVYLFAIAGPLLESGKPLSARVVDARAAGPAAEQLFIQPDEHQLTAVAVDRDGTARLIELSTGKVVDERRVTPEGRKVTCWSRATRGGLTAFGFEDGSVMLATVGTSTRFLLDKADMEALGALKPGESAGFAKGVAQRTPVGQLRLTEMAVSPSAPIGLEAGSGAVARLSYEARSDSEFVFAMREDGSAVFSLVTRTTPLGGGEPRVSLDSTPVAVAPPAGEQGLPRDVFVIGDGAGVLLLWGSGAAQRFDASKPGVVAFVEAADLLPSGRKVTAATLLLGSRTLVIGDDGGNTYGAFVARAPSSPNADRSRLVVAHRHAAGEGASAVTSLAVAERDRSFAAGFASGEVVLRHMTSDKVIARLRAGASTGAAVRASVAPKGDGVLALGASGEMTLWRIDPGHPEASAKSLFGRVWFEGAPEPGYVYQSSTDETGEPKLTLMPLLWGTLKATVYTMLLAAPMAMLAALFTSEFMNSRMKAAVKPAIETMASLPSVVMGFIAAIVLAPSVAAYLPSVLLAFVVVPLGALLAAHLWLFAPVRVAAPVTPMRRLGMTAVVVAFSGAAAFLAGPPLERALFAPPAWDRVALAGKVEPAPPGEIPAWVGARTSFSAEEQRALRRAGLAERDGVVVKPVGSVDDPGVGEALARRGLDRASIRAWLNSVYGSAWPGWFLICFPLGAIAASVAVSRTLGRSSDGIGFAEALRELALFFLKLGLGAGFAALCASGLTAAGIDPRDSVAGPFDQRNTLVVSLAMSIAVIPIIYTICEDAMSSVPESLRSASLAAGASKWQTATRVVLPVAASGIFSACMIGLGRAVGETMIVLMATGNTPVMTGSIFDGMRTLSANIAVEMPEAAVGSTHYRVLFLCGLTLFAMTFLINTAAEVVRQRFRTRSGVL